jgi:quercetin dioxygenase-like cupin family protein
MSSVTRCGAIAALLLATVARSDAPATPPSTEEGRIVHIKDVQWTPSKLKEFPPGAMSSVIAVDPTTGGSIAYGKLPAGSALATHWHSFPEYTLLLSGQATFTVAGKATELSPGDFIMIPAKVRHSLKCGAAAECVVFTRRGGATDYHFES